MARPFGALGDDMEATPKMPEGNDDIFAIIANFLPPAYQALLRQQFELKSIEQDMQAHVKNMNETQHDKKYAVKADKLNAAQAADGIISYCAPGEVPLSVWVESLSLYKSMPQPGYNKDDPKSTKMYIPLKYLMNCAPLVVIQEYLKDRPNDTRSVEKAATQHKRCDIVPFGMGGNFPITIHDAYVHMSVIVLRSVLKHARHRNLNLISVYKDMMRNQLPVHVLDILWSDYPINLEEVAAAPIDEISNYTKIYATDAFYTRPDVPLAKQLPVVMWARSVGMEWGVARLHVNITVMDFLIQNKYPFEHYQYWNALILYATDIRVFFMLYDLEVPIPDQLSPRAGVKLSDYPKLFAWYSAVESKEGEAAIKRTREECLLDNDYYMLR